MNEDIGRASLAKRRSGGGKWYWCAGTCLISKESKAIKGTIQQHREHRSQNYVALSSKPLQEYGAGNKDGRSRAVKDITFP